MRLLAARQDLAGAPGAWIRLAAFLDIEANASYREWLDSLVTLILADRNLGVCFNMRGYSPHVPL